MTITMKQNKVFPRHQCRSPNKMQMPKHTKVTTTKCCLIHLIWRVIYSILYPVVCAVFTTQGKCKCLQIWLVDMSWPMSFIICCSYVCIHRQLIWQASSVHSAQTWFLTSATWESDLLETIFRCPVQIRSKQLTSLLTSSKKHRPLRRRRLD